MLHKGRDMGSIRDPRLSECLMIANSNWYLPRLCCTICTCTAQADTFCLIPLQFSSLQVTTLSSCRSHQRLSKHRISTLLCIPNQTSRCHVEKFQSVHLFSLCWHHYVQQIVPVIPQLLCGCCLIRHQQRPSIFAAQFQHHQHGQSGITRLVCRPESDDCSHLHIRWAPELSFS